MTLQEQRAELAAGVQHAVAPHWADAERLASPHELLAPRREATVIVSTPSMGGESGFVRAGEELRMSTPRAAVKLASLAAGIGLAALLSGPGFAGENFRAHSRAMPRGTNANNIAATAKTAMNR